MRSIMRALAALSLMGTLSAELSKQRDVVIWGMLPSRKSRPASLLGCNRGSGDGYYRALDRESAKRDALNMLYRDVPPASDYRRGHAYGRA